MANYPPAGPYFGPPYSGFATPSTPAAHPGGSFQNPQSLPHHQPLPHEQAALSFQQNAALPGLSFSALPTPDPAQLAAFWNQVQNGSVPPPFPPPFTQIPAFAPPPPPPLPPSSITQSYTPFPLPPKPPQPATFQTTAVSNSPRPKTLPPHIRVMTMAERDKEDGEVSDADSWQKAPDGPRAAAQSSQPFARTHAEPNTSSRMKPNATANQAPQGRPPGASGDRTHDAHVRSLPQNASPQVRRHPLDPPPGPAPPQGGKGSQRPESSLGLDRAGHAAQAGQPAAHPTPTATHARREDGVAKQREEVEAFIKILHAAGYVFADVLEEGVSVELLEEVYRNLHFPTVQKKQSAAEPGEAPRSNAQVSSIPGLQSGSAAPARVSPPTRGAAQVASNNNASQPNGPKPVLSVATSAPAIAAPPPSQPPAKTPVSASSAAGSAARMQAPNGQTADVPLDRADYIKRLMAAKNSKTAKAQKTTPSPSPAQTAGSQPSPATAPVPAPAPQPTSTETPATAVHESNPELTTPSGPAVEDPEEELKRRKAETNKKLFEKIAAIKAQQERRAEQGKRNGTEAEQMQDSSVSHAAPELATSRVDSTTPLARDNHTQPRAPAVNDARQGIQPLQQPLQPSFSGGIPGLSMQPPPNSESTTPPTLALRPTESRKRPVASDFDNLGSQPKPAFKKPFGQSSDYLERVIVEASDAEDSDMDLDEDEGPQPPTSAGTSPSTSSRLQKAALQNISRLTGLPPASAQSMPSGAMTPGAAKTAEELKKKEAALLSLKRTLAQREAERKAKQLESSRAQTPVTPLQDDGANLPQQLPARRSAIQTTNGTTASSRDASQPLESVSATASPHPSSDWRSSRRTEILSAFETEQAASRKRLEELKLEMQKIEEDSLRRQKDKDSLIAELENLGIDTEGMHHAELQAKKDEIMQQYEEDGAEVGKAPETEVPTVDAQPVSQTHSETVSAEEVASATKDSATTQFANQDMSMQDASEGELDESDANEAAMDMSDSEVDKSDDEIDATLIHKPVSEQPPVEQPPAEVQPAPEADDSEDFYSPEPATGAASQTVDNTASTEDAYPDLDSEGPNVAGEDVDMVDAEVENKEEPLAAISRTEDGEETAEDEDDYEPSEAVQKTSEAATGPPVPSTEGIDAAASLTNSASSPMSSSSADTQVNRQEIQRAAESAASPEQTQPSATHSQSPAIADDLAPEIQPEVQRTVSHQPPTFELIELEDQPATKQIPSSQPAQHSRFTPYESPLRTFQSYRFHQGYSQTVRGGFRSLTYSHRIDPSTPLCAYEVAGGVCNDNTCRGQHFRDIRLSDDNLLVQLGVQPMDSAEENAQYRQGLRQVLKELKRERHVKDVEVVASAIAQYRREFLKDPTRVIVFGPGDGATAGASSAPAGQI